MSDRLQRILESKAMDLFREHCLSDTSVEMCGLFVIWGGEVGFVPCKNVAYDRKRSFLIHPSEFVACTEQGDVIGVGHSHTIDPVRPSPEDIASSENCKLPYVIMQVATGEVASYDPTGAPVDLIGRTWSLGVSDCYTIVRDYFKQQGVELRDYVRNSSDCLHKESMFLAHFAENDFVDVTGRTPQKHDVFLIQVLANIPNHAAVYVDDNLILHHLQGRLSCRDPFGGYWQRHAVKMLRHKKWL